MNLRKAMAVILAATTLLILCACAVTVEKEYAAPAVTDNAGQAPASEPDTAPETEKETPTPEPAAELTAKTETAAEADGTEKPKKTEKPVPEGAVRVSTVDEFLAAIAPDTTIYLEAGDYNLSTASDYGKTGKDAYSWSEEFDGPQLVISGINGLSIIGEGTDLVTVLAEPRYANVIRFEKCSELDIERLTAGHTIEPGYCTGGVLEFEGCGDVDVDGCELYGCGTYGINALLCNDFEISDCLIRDCTYGGLVLGGCRDFKFDDCVIRSCEDVFEVVNIADCFEVEFSGCEIKENRADAFIVLFDSEAVRFEDCVFKGNRADIAFRFFGDAPVFDECKFEGNKMKRWLPKDAKNDPGFALPVGPDGKELDISKLS